MFFCIILCMFCLVTIVVYSWYNTKVKENKNLWTIDCVMFSMVNNHIVVSK